MSTLYPLFLNLQGRVCVVVGGSEMAEGKIRELLDADAKVRVIAPAVTEQVAAWSQAGRLQWVTRVYERGDMRDAFLVVSVADTETNARVFEEAEVLQIFCNAVDDIEHCSCYASAVVRRGPLQIAISTAGKSPALAQRLRKELEERFGEEYAPWVRSLGDVRSRLFQDKGLDGETRRRILREQASASAFESFRDSLKADSNRQNSGEDSEA
ncbi:MAG TPA: bifunctional precorrin-2 dehydrogenase/sirohydrochlorin ferrochelatase [Candidatus Dormibacteraeota bacterium]|nr:bifunctional precorrin-2 dehydrogenase/sirohydrochlorin ferrochelatase [Candidatus Dormibacteraeota bacterium]